MNTIDVTAELGRPAHVYVQDQSLPHAGIVVLHGSDGGSSGIANSIAAALAKEGFAALSLPYFDLKGLPDDLLEIDLSSAHRAFAWFKFSRFVQGGPTALHGYSRGAEMAFLIGTIAAERKLSPLPDALVMHIPSSQAQSNFSPKKYDPACWTGGGVGQGDWKVEACGARPISGLAAWKWDGLIAPSTQIEASVFPNPIFVTHGTQDPIWPVDYSHKIEADLKASGRNVTSTLHPQGGLASLPDSAKCEFHYFEGESHFFSPAAHSARFKLMVRFLRSVAFH